MTYFKEDAIRNLRPNSLYGMVGDKFLWDETNEQTEPTQSELDAETLRLQTEYDANQYQRDRQYPELGEQLDMLFHDMTAGKGTKDGEWYKAVAKVKTDNPKPTE